VTTVIVFDLLDNYVAFANARAHADRNNSHFVIMAERKHDAHRRILSRLATKEQKMTKWIESVAGMGSSPPPRALLESLEGYGSDSEAEAEDGGVDGYIQDPTTCARIYPKDAVSVIYKLVSGLGKGHGDGARQPLFKFAEVTDVDNNGITEHTCTVLLPSIETNSQPKSFSGTACLSRALARKGACFELCQDLFKRGLLDSRLFPRGHSHLLLEKQRPSYLSPLVQDELSDHDDDDLSPPKSYTRRQPNFWLNTLHDITGKLFPVRISIKGVTNRAEPHNPLLLLTRAPLPPLSAVELFNLPNHLECRITPMEPFIIHQERLESLHKYTVRLIRALTFRSVDCVGGPPPYYLAPLKTNGHDEIEIHQSIPLPEGENLIDWDAVFSCLRSHSNPMQGRTSSELRVEIQDGILQNRMPELSRKFEAISIRADLNPRSRPDGEKVARVAQLFAKFHHLTDMCRMKRMQHTSTWPHGITKTLRDFKPVTSPSFRLACLPLQPITLPHKRRATHHKKVGSRIDDYHAF
jgi:endoribonuclease Dicer